MSASGVDSGAQSQAVPSAPQSETQQASMQTLDVNPGAPRSVVIENKSPAEGKAPIDFPWDASESERVQAIPALLEGILGPDKGVYLKCVQHILKLLCTQRPEGPPNIADTPGVIARLISFMKIGDHSRDLGIKAAWCLTNIAAGESKHVEAMLELGVLPPLVTMARSGDYEQANQAIWAMGNIAGDSLLGRDRVLRATGYDIMLRILTRFVETEAKGACQSNSNSKQPDNQNNNNSNRPADAKNNTPESLKTARTVLWSMSNCIKRKPRPPFQSVEGILRYIPAIFKNFSDTELCRNAMACLRFMTDDDGSSRIAAVVRAGLIPDIVRRVDHPDPETATDAMRAAGNITSGTDHQTQLLLGAGFLQVLRKRFGRASCPQNDRKEMFYALSNITAGTETQVRSVLDSGLLSLAIQSLSGGSDGSDVQKEAAWVVSNAISTSSSGPIIANLVEEGVLSAIMTHFKRFETAEDSKIGQMCLEGIYNLFRRAVHTRAEDCPGLQSKLLQRVKQNDVINVLRQAEERCRSAGLNVDQARNAVEAWLCVNPPVDES